jgi:hypothetical protein
MQEVNIKACEKVEELERQEAEARLAKARAIPFDVGRIRLVESTPEAVESTPVESTSEFDWVESTGLGLSQNDCCCVNSTVSRLDSVVELTARRPDCARRADCSAA